MRRVPGCVFVIGLTVLISGCASTGYTPKPFPTPGSTPNSPTPNSATESPETKAEGRVLSGPALAYSVTGTALSLRGTPYRNGGHDPSGFDCSGFVSYVFGQNGIAVPRTVGDQYHAGREVNPQQGLQPGDLVFFTTVSPGASHVGILIGGDEFVHAPSSSGVVRVEHLSSTYWAPRYLGARRLN